MDPQIAQIALDRLFLGIAITSVQLQRVVAYLETDVGRKPFCHGAMGGDVRTACVERNRSAPDHQPSCLEFGCHVCHTELERLKLGQRLSKLLAHSEVRPGRLKARSRAAQR